MVQEINHTDGHKESKETLILPSIITDDQHATAGRSKENKAAWVLRLKLQQGEQAKSSTSQKEREYPLFGRSPENYKPHPSPQLSPSAIAFSLPSPQFPSTNIGDRVYFHACFKLFDITRWTSGPGKEVWFDWVERRRNKM
ncbi:hypothetical protein H5410_034852 [Solanum commersonii]|uniref:Uncharacterized protein n=1 Tax=Solanum commersonii TaxID=4109 RepID=A0A9J5Y2U7_SOLCO|nr:hypothetical protein H5410_034852 [Solanum commersonii]